VRFHLSELCLRCLLRQLWLCSCIGNWHWLRTDLPLRGRNKPCYLTEQMHLCLRGGARTKAVYIFNGCDVTWWAARAFVCLHLLQSLLVGRALTKEDLFFFPPFLHLFVQEDYAGYDFENRLHVRIHSALASMTAAAQPWHPTYTLERAGKNYFLKCHKTILNTYVYLSVFIYLFLFSCSVPKHHLKHEDKCVRVKHYSWF